MSDIFYQSQQWRDLRYACLRRDGWRCTCCGVSVRKKGASRVDHIKPRRQHPELALVLANLRTLCIGCDAKRHSEKGGHHRIKPEIDQHGLTKAWR